MDDSDQWQCLLEQRMRALFEVHGKPAPELKHDIARNSKEWFDVCGTASPLRACSIHGLSAAFN